MSSSPPFLEGERNYGHPTLPNATTYYGSTTPHPAQNQPTYDGCPTGMSPRGKRNPLNRVRTGRAVVPIP